MLTADELKLLSSLRSSVSIFEIQHFFDFSVPNCLERGSTQAESINVKLDLFSHLVGAVPSATVACHSTHSNFRLDETSSVLLFRNRMSDAIRLSSPIPTQYPIRRLSFRKTNKRWKPAVNTINVTVHRSHSSLHLNLIASYTPVYLHDILHALREMLVSHVSP